MTSEQPRNKTYPGDYETEEHDPVTNLQGGKQSATPYFFRGLPPLALERISRILKTGAEKYESDPFGDILSRNWMRITSDEHLEHILYHAIQYMHGDVSEDHAGNLATRALFFLDMKLIESGEQHG